MVASTPLFKYYTFCTFYSVMDRCDPVSCAAPSLNEHLKYGFHTTRPFDCYQVLQYQSNGTNIDGSLNEHLKYGLRRNILERNFGEIESTSHCASVWWYRQRIHPHDTAVWLLSGTNQTEPTLTGCLQISEYERTYKDLFVTTHPNRMKDMFELSWCIVIVWNYLVYCHQFD